MSVTVATSGFKPRATPATARARAQAGRWEVAGAALCLVQFSEPLFPAIAQSQGASEAPSYARLFFFPVYAFLALMVWRDRRVAGATIAATPLLAGLVGLAVCSSLWSIDAGGTLRRAVWLALTMTFALYL